MNEDEVRWPRAVTYKLICEQKHSLQAKLALAKVKEVFQRGAEQIEHHGVVVTFCAEPADERHADAACEGLVDFAFILKLRMLSLDRL
jgi:hypothetical protein